jgi:nitrogen fixation/metabolism regulation signal transduction histidine kinase
MLRKITYINSVLATCVAIIGILYIADENTQNFDSYESWFIAALCLGLFVLLVAGITQLVGRAARKSAETVWVFRLAIVLSVFWVLLCAILIEPLAYDSVFESYYNVSEFLAVGIVPPVIFLGLVWVTKAMLLSKETGD